jgi:hypothetical protein
MVNLWPGVTAECLCDKHLNAVLAESTNLLIPSMRKGISIDKYILHGCVDLPSLWGKIVCCISEAEKRGHKWKYSAPSTEDVIIISEYRDRYIKSNPEFFADLRKEEMAKMNMMILSFRCPECKKRIEKLHNY